ncbi:MAG: MATE family efflux transporter [Clostridiales bacterium]|nr:MATE family efflux transporter [Clostridiales bacterium]
MEHQANDFLETEKIGKLMRKFAVPCIISLLVGALYNIVDQVFIGWGVGFLGNGATNVVFPMTVIALAIATMIGDGACTFVSIRLGAKDPDSAHKSVGNAIIISLVASLLLTVIYFVFQDSILYAFGATENNLPYAKEYFTWITIGIPFYMFANTLNPIIRSDGNPKFAMLCMLGGAVLNIILDPIAIFVLGWGMRGAAIATVLGQLLSAGLSLAYIFRMKAIKLSKISFRLNGSLIMKFITLGLCTLLSQLSMVISMGFTQNMLRTYGSASIYGADIPITVIGIVCKFFQIVMSIVIGISAGCIPIVGYNIGAGRKDRVKGILVRLIGCEAIVGVVALCLFQFFPAQLISLFGSESDLYMQFAVVAFRTYLAMVVLACVNKASFIFLQAMGRPWLSTGLSFLREVLLSVPLVMILPRYMGLDGILYSMPISDLIAFVPSVLVLVLTYRQLSKDEPLKSELAPENAI